MTNQEASEMIRNDMKLHHDYLSGQYRKALNMAIDALLKEQDKKQIKVNKCHLISLKRNDIFSMSRLYESICETLLDDGVLKIVRTDDHEKVDFTWEIVQEE